MTFNIKQLATSAIIFIAIMTTLPSYSNGKVITGSITSKKFKEQNWNYFSKFGMDIGKGEYKLRLRAKNAQKMEQKTFNVDLEVHLDSSWSDAQLLQECEQKSQLSKASIEFLVQNDGSWTSFKNGYAKQSARPHVWFFVISDCFNQFPDGIELEYEMHMFNSDGSHFSFEEKGLIYPNLLLLGVIFVFFVQNVSKFAQYKEQNDGELDWALLFVLGALAFEFCSIGCDLIHQWRYSYNGQGSMLFGFLGQSFSVLAQVLLTLLFILISWGWTINYVQVKQLNKLLPLAIAVAVVHLALVAFERFAQTDLTSWHNYDSSAGMLIIAIRVLLFAYFIQGIVKTYSEVQMRVKEFIIRFGVLGTVYFLVFPILVLVTCIVDEHYRHKVVTIGTQVFQSIGIIILSLTFTTKGNGYYNASYKSRSLLPQF